jgi:hypothetical protein
MFYFQTFTHFLKNNIRLMCKINKLFEFLIYINSLTPEELNN